MQIVHLYSQDIRGCNHVYWSKLGRYLVVAGFINRDANQIPTNNKPMSGTLKFFDADSKRLLKDASHPSMTGLHWSPCGRFCVTSVCQPYNSPSGESSDCGYKIYNFQGEELFFKGHGHFHQFLWRPR